MALSTDDPAMFETTLLNEYSSVYRAMGMPADSLVRIAEMGFENAFIDAETKAHYVKSLRTAASQNPPAKQRAHRPDETSSPRKPRAQ